MGLAITKLGLRASASETLSFNDNRLLSRFDIRFTLYIRFLPEFVLIISATSQNSLSSFATSLQDSVASFDDSFLPLWNSLFSFWFTALSSPTSLPLSKSFCFVSYTFSVFRLLELIGSFIIWFWFCKVFLDVLMLLPILLFRLF